MKIINGEMKKLILEEGDCIEICSMKGNHSRILVRFEENAFHIDDLPIEKIELLQKEETAIKAMKDYMEKNPKE